MTAAGEWATTGQLAKALGISKQAILAKGWNPHRDVPCRGGKRREYSVESLPAPVRHALALAEPSAPTSSNPGHAAGLRLVSERAAAAEHAAEAKARGLAAWGHLPEKARAIARRRADVLDLCAGFLTAAGYQCNGSWSTAGCRVFLAEVASGRIVLSEPVGVSYATLIRWRDRRAEHGLAGLAPGWQPHNRGITSVGGPVQEWLVAMMYARPGMDIGGKEGLAELAKARFGAATPGEAAVRRWVKGWMKANADTYLRITNPDEWKRKWRFSVGDADAEIERLNQLWELDSSPADVLCADGKRYALIACIDVWSRRARLLVTPTSNSVAIAALVRRCIIDWGLPEGVRHDQGDDYDSQHLGHVYTDLDVHQHVCRPFHPEEKG